MRLLKGNGMSVLNRGLRLAFAAVIAFGPMAPLTARADGTQNLSMLRITSADALPAVRHVALGLNKSIIVELPIPVRDVMVSNPEQVDAVMQTSRRAYVIGKQTGEANVFFTDENGRQVLALELSIQRDLSALADLLNRLIPESAIKVEAIGENVVLTGSVRTPADATRASEIVNKFLGAQDDAQSTASAGSSNLTLNVGQSGSGNSATESSRVINMITVEGKEQVLLKVSVVEMERNIVKQLGVDLDALVNSGNFAFSALSSLPYPFTSGLSGVAQAGVGWQSGPNSVSAVLKALEQNNLLHTLAEPNLTAISGETANFLAGGEFPVVTGIDTTTNTAQVTFKQFGVGLAFTPTVMSEGRISMKISTEVSELSDQGAVSLAGGITIPGLKVRRAETTVELPSGGSLVIAGLLSDQSKQALSGYPGLKNLPVLGTLFRSRDFQKNESELVVLVTPYIAKPVARGKLSQPDDGFGWASDVNTDLLGQMNRVYGRHPEQAPVGKFDGDVGFIVE